MSDSSEPDRRNASTNSSLSLRTQNDVESAEKPYEWFKYFPPAKSPDDVDLPLGASLLVSVNDRLATFSYCYDPANPMKSAAIKNSPFYDNSLTNFIVNNFHYGVIPQPELPVGHFVIRQDYSLWFSEDGKQTQRRILSWDEALDLGFSTAKLARMALYFLYPALALNRAMFTRFLLDTVENKDLLLPQVSRAVQNAARSESILDPRDRIGAPIPYELLSFAGPPVRVDYEGFESMLKHVTRSSFVAFLDEFNYLPGATQAIDETWGIMLKFFSFWLKQIK